MKTNLKYKPSNIEWLGGIPAEWETKRLRFCITTNPTKSEIQRLAPDTQISFVPMESVGELGGLKLEQTKSLEEVATGYTYFRNGDVVMAKITPCFENWKGAIADNLENGIGFGTTELHVLRPFSHMDRRYLFYITLGHAFRNIGKSFMYGAGGQKRVPDDYVLNFRHPIPTLDEQRAIADFLDRETGRIDGLIERKERQIELLKEKRQALISQAVTKGLDPNAKMKPSGVEWLGDIPYKWNVLPLRRLVKSIKTGGTPSGAEAQFFEDDGYNWFSPSDFTDDLYLGKSNRTLSELGKNEVRLFPPMTVMMIGIGATIGKIGLSPNASSCNQQINGIECGDKLNAVFATYYLKTLRDFITKCGKYTTLPIINQEETKNLIITVPPVDEQRAIADFLDRETVRIDALKEKIQTSIEKLREYRTALISAAVTGKIDVRRESQ